MRSGSPIASALYILHGDIRPANTILRPLEDDLWRDIDGNSTLTDLLRNLPIDACCMVLNDWGKAKNCKEYKPKLGDSDWIEDLKMLVHGFQCLACKADSSSVSSEYSVTPTQQYLYLRNMPEYTGNQLMELAALLNYDSLVNAFATIEYS